MGFIRKIILLILCIIILQLTACASIWDSQVHFKPNTEVMRQANKEAETVVVLHGIARTNQQTHLLAERIAKAGYEVYNINYPSTEQKIEGLVEYIHQEFLKYGIDKKKSVNIVAHSMGGLITRAYLHKYPMDNLDKVVMIATPNKGSEVADFFKDWEIYDKLFGPAGQQLGTSDVADLEKLFGPVDYNVSIIAGGSSFNPIFSAMLDGPDDGVVSVESTKLEGMNDHIVVPNLHGIQLYSKLDAQLTISVLKNGKFDRSLIKERKKLYASPRIRY